ncbi:MAG: DUF2911 domain-containing protein [Bacteroidota bacterium]
MKKYISLFILCLLFTLASAQLRTPSLSPMSTLKQRIGLTEIEVEYFRPSLRSRSIFDEKGLIPYGEFWRAGANNATKISFSSDVVLGQSKLEAGSYSILIKPYANYWEIYFYPYEGNNWNTYVPKEPLKILKAKVENMASLLESFEISFQNLELHTASLIFEWEKIRISIPLEVDDKEKVLASIERTMAGPSQFDYFNAAVYLHDAGLDLEQALGYIQKVTASDKAFFFQVSREAQILKDLNRKEEALISAKRALTLAREAKNSDFIRINEKLIQLLE